MALRSMRWTPRACPRTPKWFGASPRWLKAEGYRQRAMLTRAEGEYRQALKLNPNAPTSYMALADVQCRQHKYEKSADTLNLALAVAPNGPMILAQLARSYAQLRRSS